MLTRFENVSWHPDLFLFMLSIRNYVTPRQIAIFYLVVVPLEVE